VVVCEPLLLVLRARGWLPAPVALEPEDALMGPVVAALPLLEVAEVGPVTRVPNVADHH
jgi:hypothetical protein